MKDFKKQLKKEAETQVPDLYGEIMASADSSGLFEGGYAVDNGGGVKAVRRIGKPFLYSACTFLIVCVSVVAIVLPLIKKNGSSVPPVLSPIELSADDFYGVGALSSAKLLSDGTKTFKSRVNDGADAVREQINYFNKYLSAFEAFLGEGFVKTEVAENADPHYAQYEKTMTVNTAGLESYVMYYNETLTEDDGEERSYVLNGVMTLDGREYLLHGGRTVEDDGEEREEELKIRAYTADNPENFVEMEQEISEENGERETEYVYRIYSDNKLSEETSVGFETETKNGRTETEFELEFRNGDGKGKYKVEREVRNGVAEISVKYKLNGENGEFEVREKTIDGEKCYEYIFKDGSSLFLKK